MKALTIWKSPTKWRCAITEVTDSVATLLIEQCRHVVGRGMDANFHLSTYIDIIVATELRKGQKKYRSAKLPENFSGSHQELKAEDTLH